MTTATVELARRTARIPIGTATLDADISVPAKARGVVVFAHGSGSSRHSPRNLNVAAFLNERDMATVLTDLLTDEEEHLDTMTSELRFDVRLLAQRLTAIVDWTAREHDVGRLPIGLFGASTGAAAALETAARRPAEVHAVVSRGGRPDLANSLDLVRAPVLLIVGSADAAVLDLNRKSLHHPHGIRSLEIVGGATHLFEEEGALERVAQLARDWFSRYVCGDKEEW
jgi:putative phosphoribosyl transferase